MLVLLLEGGKKQMNGCPCPCLVDSGPRLCHRKATHWPLLEPSCRAAQLRSPQTFLGWPVARLVTGAGPGCGLSKLRCVPALSLRCTRPGGEGGGAGGPALEMKPSIMCLPVHGGGFGPVCGAAIPSEKQTSAPLEQISSSQPHWKAQ